MVARVATRLKDYGTLMKPRITFLALVTTFTGAWLAVGGIPEPTLLLFMLLGTAFGASSASTLNNYVDRDLDRVMDRTKNRSLPSGRVDPKTALGLGVALGVTGVVLLALTVNLLSAAVLAFTILFYILVYTLWLKRTSPLSTEIGGVAGSLPPVLGWVAIEGSFGPEALALFAIMFVWQPPHFWALAIYYLDDYERAGLPRFPVVRSMEETKWRIMLYTALLIPLSLSPYFLRIVNVAYLTGASILGLIYLAVTVSFVRNSINRASAIRLFSASNLYLLALFVLMLFTANTGPS